MEIRGARTCWVAGVFAAMAWLAGCASQRPTSRQLGLERRFYAAAVQGRTFNVSYLRAGDAAAQRVIFIHGTPGSAMAFRRYLTDPIPGVETIAVDRPGFGSTTPIVPVPPFEAQAEAIAPLLQEREGKWPILVGHSLGGPIAARLAATHPDKVGGLVILAGAVDPSLERVHPAQLVADLPLVCYLLPTPLRHANHELLRSNGSRKRLADDLDEVSAPVIVAHGMRDRLVPFANVDFLRDRLEGAAAVEIIALEDEGHFIPWTREGLVRQAVRQLAVGASEPSPARLVRDADSTTPPSAR